MSVHSSGSCRHFVTHGVATQRTIIIIIIIATKWRFDIHQTCTFRCSLRKCTVYKICTRTNVWRLSPYQKHSAASPHHNHHAALQLHTADPQQQANERTTHIVCPWSLTACSLFSWHAGRYTPSVCFTNFCRTDYFKTQRAVKPKLKSDNRSDTATSNQVTWLTWQVCVCVCEHILSVRLHRTDGGQVLEGGPPLPAYRKKAN